jgi:hypothetical protein
MNAKRLRALLCAVAALPAVLSSDLAISANPTGNPIVTVGNTASNPVPVTGSITVGNSVVPVEVSNADPIPVNENESTSDWAILSARGSSACTPYCSFVFANLDIRDPSFGTAIPAGKALLVQNITVTYGPNDQKVFPATAAIQLGSPFYRHFIGELLPTPGFTGASGMATANVNFVVTGTMTASVGFTDPNNRPTVLTGCDVFVSGLIIDAP